MYSKTYKCDSCEVTLTVGVPLTESPTHPCPRHANKMRKLIEDETRNSKRRQDIPTESD